VREQQNLACKIFEVTIGLPLLQDGKLGGMNPLLACFDMAALTE
jgi:hypothetical protein